MTDFKASILAFLILLLPCIAVLSLLYSHEDGECKKQGGEIYQHYATSSNGATVTIRDCLSEDGKVIKKK